jgi:Ser/Thr protein kinase RdoA (MazF antagonist)
MDDCKLLNTVTESLAKNYGIEGRLARLPGENLNFLVTDKDGTKHVFKIVDEHMPPDVVAMEYAAMEYAVAAGFEPHLPRIKENRLGNIESGINIHRNASYRCRLIEFIDGTVLSDLSDISENLLIHMGKTIAEFGRVMRNFEHPAARRSHRWNLAEAEQHEAKILLISDADKHALLIRAFAAWNHAKGALSAVPWQFIHGDAHHENILVEDERVIGLIDFGDCCYNPAVCDLAICVAYLMMRGDDPLQIAGTILEGYQGVRPLSETELDLLYPLVCARLAVSVCVANKRKTIDPDNPNWFGGEGAAWRLLGRLQAMGAEAFRSGLYSP